MKDLNVGDLVEIRDGSWSVRIDKYSLYSDLHGISTDVFEVLNIHFSVQTNGYHDIFIKNIRTGGIYLHSSCMVEKVNSKIKEVTMKDLEEKYGCKVKVVK